MGTNYFLIKELNVNQSITFDMYIHLGKSSAGWQFLFDGSTGMFIDYASMESFIRNFGGHIEDEYKQVVDFEELLEKIRSASLGKRHVGSGCYFYNDCSYSKVPFS